MKFRSVLVAAAVGMFAVAGHAVPVNLVSNGSFESGLTGWTLTGTQGFQPAVAIVYNSTSQYPTGAYGEPVAPANTVTQSPDLSGTRAAYFVADNAVNAGLTQSVFLAAGNYRIGFDVYAPANGYSNPFDARFSATIANVTLANYLVSSTASTTWVNFSGLASVGTSGQYDVSFLFNTPGLGMAKDVIVDRVFVVSSTETGGTPVPEPASLALISLGLLGLGATRKRLRR